MENKFSVFFMVSFYGNSISCHIVTNTIGSSFARKLLSTLLSKFTKAEEKDCFKTFLLLSPSNDEIQKNCLCSVFSLDENYVIENPYKPLEYEIGNILYNEKNIILNKIYSSSTA